MALVVEDGSGLANAESYLSVANTDSYLAVRGNPAAWTTLSVGDKEAALRAATKYIDVNYRFKGTRVRREQALYWPRTGVDDGEFALDSNVLPSRLKDATAEMALRAASGDVLPDIAKPGSIRRERVKVSSIEKETEYFGGTSQAVEYREADLLLRPLLDMSYKVRRT